MARMSGRIPRNVRSRPAPQPAGQTGEFLPGAPHTSLQSWLPLYPDVQPGATYTPALCPQSLLHKARVQQGRGEALAQGRSG